MKKCFALVVAIVLNVTCWGQWVQSGQTLYTNNTVVVDGTSSLKIAKDEMMTQITNDNVGRSNELLFNAYRFKSGWLHGGTTKYSFGPGGYLGGAGAIRFLANYGQMDFLISPPATNADEVIDWGTSRMTFTREGGLGIGTTPAVGVKLDVSGVIRTFNKDNASATWDNLSLWSDGAKSYIQATGDEAGLFIKSNGGGKVVFESKVGVGTDALGENTLQVNGSIGGSSIELGRYEMLTQFTSDMYGRSHELLFGAKRTTGGWLENATVYSHGPGDYSGGAGAIRFIGNGGQLQFFVSPVSTNAGDPISWGSPKMLVTRDGLVKIGGSSAGNLEVNGTIRATEIKVEAATTSQLNVDGILHAANIKVSANGQTADFVFDENYDLKNLDDVEAYIKEHKHLPEIPSAAEMEEKGVDLAEMNKLLLQKVEELTLYIIELETKGEEEKIERTSIEKRLSHIESLLLRSTK